MSDDQIDCPNDSCFGPFRHCPGRTALAQAETEKAAYMDEKWRQMNDLEEAAKEDDITIETLRAELAHERGLLAASVQFTEPSAEEAAYLKDRESPEQQLYNRVRDLLGFIQLMRQRDDIPPEVKSIMNTHHSVVDAAAYLTQFVPPIYRRMGPISIPKEPTPPAAEGETK